ncbi:MAG: hypothetical protein LBL15_02455 [Oscillospiraceae bacterium]|jgi:hypothetical protein|nr:hypothetical protein [Oscillospiraceae bacterium]
MKSGIKMDYKDLGKLVATNAVAAVQESNPAFAAFVKTCFGRYLRNDWGELSKDDSKQNDQAIRSGKDRIFASYLFPADGSQDAVNWFHKSEDRIWIITEWDHSITTVLFPSEY